MGPSLEDFGCDDVAGGSIFHQANKKRHQKMSTSGQLKYLKKKKKKLETPKAQYNEAKSYPKESKQNLIPKNLFITSYSYCALILKR